MQDPENVYIGRKGIVFIDGERFPKKDSLWANPYRIGKDGDRKEIVNKYILYICEKIKKGEITKENLYSLKNKKLGCWCRPEKCHGDILENLVDIMLSPSKNLPDPIHERSHFVDKDICVGAFPLPEHKDLFLKNWVVVSLVKEKTSFGEKNLHFPLASGRAGTFIKMQELISKIEKYLEKGFLIYIHCQGGIGRSNTVAAILLGRRYLMKTEEVIKWLEKCRKNRPYKERNFIPIPETNFQVKMIHNFLGGSKPDRSDTSWLKKLKKLRESS